MRQNAVCRYSSQEKGVVFAACPFGPVEGGMNAGFLGRGEGVARIVPVSERKGWLVFMLY